MGFLIDSNILIAGERQKINLPELISRYEDEPIAISAISASELRHGIYRAQNNERAEQRRFFVEYILSTYDIIPFDLDAARQHAILWAKLQANGIMIGAHDLLIAATALAVGYGVITINTGEFTRVPGLTVVGVHQPPVRGADTP